VSIRLPGIAPGDHEQALPPGTKMPEDELGAVRIGHAGEGGAEAFAIRGLVDAPPRRTTTTAKPTPEEAKEVFNCAAA
jgi:hypothetical protein